MTTIVNNPMGGNEESSSTGMLVGIFIAIVIIAVFFIYGLPAIRGNKPAPQNDKVDVNIQLPAPINTEAPTPTPTINPEQL